MKKVIILGIESSCDETSAAVVANGTQVISSVVASQIKLHEKYGGVVPEIAARAHIENIIPVIRQALQDARIAPDQIDAVAIANRPGLTPALVIGVTAAKALAWAWQKPLIGINHIHGHLHSVMLDDQPDIFPAVALIVSGGHTSIYDCQSPMALTLIGRTIDDAAGEAFDKVATILNLPYPGGPSIEKASASGNPKAVRFPRTMLAKDSLDFSFSGIKTAVLYHCNGQDMTSPSRVDDMPPHEIADIAASFQQAVIDVLVKKCMLALDQTHRQTVFLGGGVAANSLLRAQLQDACDRRGTRLIIAQKKYCTDNAAMVAGLAWFKFKANRFDDLSLEARAAAY